MLRHRRCVPAPLRHCAERHCLFVKLGKSLQAGHVAGKRKFAVADRQRRERLELAKNGIVPRDERTSIDA